MFSVVVAWLAVLAVSAAAVLFGRTTHRRGARRRRRSALARVGLLVSLSGPWLVLIAAASAGAATGAWVSAAAYGAAGVVAAALVGLVLDHG